MAEADEVDYAAQDATFSAQEAIKLDQAMKDMAAQTAATQMAVAYGLALIPVVGQIAAALYAIIGLIGSAYAKRQGKKYINRAQDELRGLIDEEKQRYTARMRQVTNDEIPAAEQLAMSGALGLPPGAGTEGLGNIFKKWAAGWKKGPGKGGKNIKNAAIRAVADIHIRPIQSVGKTLLRALQVGAKLTGQKKFAERMKTAERKWDGNIERMTRHAASNFDTWKTTVKTLQKAGRLTISTQGGEVAKQKSREMLDKVRVQLRAETDKIMARLDDPAYREELRKTLARAMLRDPTLPEEARALQALSERAASDAAEKLRAMAADFDAATPAVAP